MRGTKRIFTMLIVGLVIVATSITAFAASASSTPAELVAGLTGRTTDNVIAEKVESQKTYGEIAKEAGKFVEFKAEMLKLKKDKIAAQVEEGRITDEKADAIIKSLEENQANCDGTGSAKIGQNMGARFGSNNPGQGNGSENPGQGGRHSKYREGSGLRNGSCSVPTN